MFALPSVRKQTCVRSKQLRKPTATTPPDHTQRQEHPRLAVLEVTTLLLTTCRELSARPSGTHSGLTQRFRKPHQHCHKQSYPRTRHTTSTNSTASADSRHIETSLSRSYRIPLVNCRIEHSNDMFLGRKQSRMHGGEKRYKKDKREARRDTRKRAAKLERQRLGIYLSLHDVALQQAISEVYIL